MRTLLRASTRGQSYPPPDLSRENFKIACAEYKKKYGEDWPHIKDYVFASTSGRRKHPVGRTLSPDIAEPSPRRPKIEPPGEASSSTPDPNPILSQPEHQRPNSVPISSFYSELLTEKDDCKKRLTDLKRKKDNLEAELAEDRKRIKAKEVQVADLASKIVDTEGSLEQVYQRCKAAWKEDAEMLEKVKKSFNL